VAASVTASLLTTANLLPEHKLPPRIAFKALFRWRSRSCPVARRISDVKAESRFDAQRIPARFAISQRFWIQAILRRCFLALGMLR